MRKTRVCDASGSHAKERHDACRDIHFVSHIQHLQTAMQLFNNIQTWVAWQGWYKRYFALSVSHNYHKTRSEIGDIVHAQQYKNYLDQRHNSRGRPTCRIHSSKNPPIQEIAYQCISAYRCNNKVERLRHNIARWELHSHAATHPPPSSATRHLTPNWQAHRSALNLKALKSTTAPRVRAAAFSTVWNRWNTHRR